MARHGVGSAGRSNWQTVADRPDGTGYQSGGGRRARQVIRPAGQSAVRRRRKYPMGQYNQQETTACGRHEVTSKFRGHLTVGDTIVSSKAAFHVGRAYLTARGDWHGLQLTLIGRRKVRSLRCTSRNGKVL